MDLTPEELRRLFDAVYERDMAALRKQLKAAQEGSKIEVWIPDETRQGT